MLKLSDRSGRGGLHHRGGCGVWRRLRGVWRSAAVGRRRMHGRVYVCIYVCTYVCMYVYIYIYTYIYIYAYCSSAADTPKTFFPRPPLRRYADPHEVPGLGPGGVLQNIREGIRNAAEPAEPNRTELFNSPNRTEPNRTDEFLKSPEPKRIELNRFLPEYCVNCFAVELEIRNMWQALIFCRLLEVNVGSNIRDMLQAL